MNRRVSKLIVRLLRVVKIFFCQLDIINRIKFLPFVWKNNYLFAKIIGP